MNALLFLLILTFSQEAISNSSLLPGLLDSFSNLQSPAVTCFYNDLPISEPISLCSSDGNFERAGMMKLAEILSGITFDAIDTLSPFSGETTGHPFNGSYDWHSSVHAHWMLLSIGRITGNQNIISKALERITDQTLNELIQRFSQQPSFSNPYGQTWTLLLIKELEKYPQYDKRKLENLKELISANISSRPPVSSGSYTSREFVEFSYQTTGYELPGALKNNQGVAGLRPSNLTDSDFFDPQFLRDQIARNNVSQLPTVPMPSNISLYDCHKLGRHLSTGWVDIRNVQPENRLNVCAQLERKINDVLTSKSLYSLSQNDQFVFISHWIPQFMWMPVHLSN